MSTPRRKHYLTPRRYDRPVSNHTIDECDLIEIVNQLQNKLAAGGHNLKISLPQIVVVGCQSAGKSSVLESVVGKEFLPRGSGVVTRRPTVVQLHPSEDGQEEYALFLHRGEEKFSNFENVKREIEAETYREPGPTGFSSKPISLKIYSPNVLKLTLVDLPGLIKNVVDDQSESSIEEVRKMVLQYIEQPNSLILAVSPANQDIANSDALNIAKEVDPKRERTIGVLTKLDLMDDGTNAADILENKKIFLKRGYVGVLNRSQMDIDEARDINYSLNKEKNYFTSKTCYSHMAERMGTPYLRKSLHNQLRMHIKESLPAVRKELSDKLSSMRKELDQMEEQMGFNAIGTNSAQFYMIKLVQEFTEGVIVQIYGQSELVDLKDISAGAVINYKLYTELQEYIKLPSIPTEGELMVLIANMYGIRNTLNVPSQSLDAVCKHLLTQYKEPLNKFVRQMASLLIVCVQASSGKIKNYPNLYNELLYMVTNAVDQAADLTVDSLESHLDAEMSFINIYHMDFKLPESVEGGPVKLWTAEENDSDQKRTSSTPSGDFSPDEVKKQSAVVKGKLLINQNALVNAETLRNMVQDYMRIEKKQISDAAIKYLAFFLVKKVMNFLKAELVPSLLELSNLKSLLAELEADFRERDEMLNTCSYLEEALDAVQYF